MRVILKRLLLFLLIAAALTACAAEYDPDVLPDEAYGSYIPPPYHSTEYGEPDGDDDNHVPLWTYTRYPRAVVTTDVAIDYRAYPVYGGAPAEIEELQKTESPLDVSSGPVPPDDPPQTGLTDLSKPMVALTFDDGPSAHTPRILDVLERHNARATFFTIGNLLESRKDTVIRAFDMGCEIIGHSWDHRNMTKLTGPELKTQILDTHNAIEAITGVSPPFMFRPPYGAVNNTVKDAAAELEFAIINWSVDPWDWKIRDADAVYNAVMNAVKDQSIILSHDLYGTTADAMERVIPDLIAKGYRLVTVSELLYYTYGEQLEAGKVYTNG